MKLLKLEFFKCRRRKIVLVCAAVLAAELLWFGMYLTRQDAEDLVEGWMMLFYNLALIDAIFLPISVAVDRKSTRLNSSHVSISYAVFCLKKKKTTKV